MRNFRRVFESKRNVMIDGKPIPTVKIFEYAKFAPWRAEKP